MPERQRERNHQKEHAVREERKERRDNTERRLHGMIGQGQKLCGRVTDF